MSNEEDYNRHEASEEEGENNLLMLEESDDESVERNGNNEEAGDDSSSSASSSSSSSEENSDFDSKCLDEQNELIDSDSDSDDEEEEVIVKRIEKYLHLNRRESEKFRVLSIKTLIHIMKNKRNQTALSAVMRKYLPKHWRVIKMRGTAAEVPESCMDQLLEWIQSCSHAHKLRVTDFCKDALHDDFTNLERIIRAFAQTKNKARPKYVTFKDVVTSSACQYPSCQCISQILAQWQDLHFFTYSGADPWLAQTLLQAVAVNPNCRNINIMIKDVTSTRESDVFHKGVCNFITKRVGTLDNLFLLVTDVPALLYSLSNSVSAVDDDKKQPRASIKKLFLIQQVASPKSTVDDSKKHLATVLRLLPGLERLDFLGCERYCEKDFVGMCHALQQSSTLRHVDMHSTGGIQLGQQELNALADLWRQKDKNQNGLQALSFGTFNLKETVSDEDIERTFAANKTVSMLELRVDNASVNQKIAMLRGLRNGSSEILSSLNLAGFRWNDGPLLDYLKITLEGLTNLTELVFWEREDVTENFFVALRNILGRRDSNLDSVQLPRGDSRCSWIALSAIGDGNTSLKKLECYLTYLAPAETKKFVGQLACLGNVRYLRINLSGSSGDIKKLIAALYQNESLVKIYFKLTPPDRGTYNVKMFKELRDKTVPRTIAIVTSRYKVKHLVREQRQDPSRSFDALWPLAFAAIEAKDGVPALHLGIQQAVSIIAGWSLAKSSNKRKNDDSS